MKRDVASRKWLPKKKSNVSKDFLAKVFGFTRYFDYGWLTLDTDSVNLESTLIIDLEQDLTKTTKHHFFDRSVGRKEIPRGDYCFYFFSFLISCQGKCFDILHFANLLLSQLVHVSLESYEYTNSVNFSKKI